MQQPTILRIAIVGSGGVGKSSLTLQFVYSEFIQDYEPTKANSYRRKMTLDGVPLQFDILDTAGQEDYRGIRDYFFKISEGFILVFAIDDSESVNSLATFREHILRIKQSDHVPMLIVANKCDLKGCTRNNYISQGKQYADDWHLDFIETSAKTYSDAERVFLEIGKKIRESHMASIQYPRKVENYKRRKKCTIL
ncbi:putative ral [Schistosoma mansoni]|uniref:putative ral n=1 Tax=Schistosoma mansoni TaxID=6183 RepID=UPI0001A63B04|nr:putative ral [Schistosoma mansoni]|eukprot:XP_018652204.1 putative ral [Schistosoma mansoni]